MHESQQILFVYWGFRARQRQRSVCAHESQQINERDSSNKWPIKTADPLADGIRVVPGADGTAHAVLEALNGRLQLGRRDLLVDDGRGQTEQLGPLGGRGIVNQLGDLWRDSDTVSCRVENMAIA